MRFLFAFISYPDVQKTENMYTNLVAELVRKGHEVRVICPTFEAQTHESFEGGIRVLRVNSGRIFNVSLFMKGVNTVLLNRRFTAAWKKFWSDWDLDWVVLSTPPITLVPFVQTVTREKNAHAYLILRDIFPQNALDIGIIRSGLIFKYFRKQERKLYTISDIIGCMSSGNMDFVALQDPDIVSHHKVKYLPNWIRPTENKGTSDESASFRERYGLQKAFIAVFGGNFGRPQRVDFVLDLAARLIDMQDVVFCLIGTGTEKERMVTRVKSEKLTNVRILEKLPQRQYMALIQEADIGLVNLSENFTIPNIPSRTLAYWNASLPILAATDVNTDYNREFLQKYNAGLWVQTGDLEGYVRKFMILYKDATLRKEMGANGRQAVVEEFHVSRVSEMFLKQITGTWDK